MRKLKIFSSYVYAYSGMKMLKARESGRLDSKREARKIVVQNAL